MTCVPQGGDCEGYHILAKSQCGQLTCPQCTIGTQADITQMLSRGLF